MFVACEVIILWMCFKFSLHFLSVMYDPGDDSTSAIVIKDFGFYIFLLI